MKKCLLTQIPVTTVGTIFILVSCETLMEIFFLFWALWFCKHAWKWLVLIIFIQCQNFINQACVFYILCYYYTTSFSFCCIMQDMNLILVAKSLDFGLEAKRIWWHKYFFWFLNISSLSPTILHVLKRKRNMLLIV